MMMNAKRNRPMNRLLFLAPALVALSSPAYASNFCAGFEEGYKSFQSGFSMVPMCPLEPITPLGSNPYREGIKAGAALARNNTSSNSSTSSRGPYNYNIDVESPLQKAMKVRQQNRQFELEKRRLKLEEDRLNSQQSASLPKGYTLDPAPARDLTLSENELLLPSGQILVLDPDTLMYSLR